MNGVLEDYHRILEENIGLRDAALALARTAIVLGCRAGSSLRSAEPRAWAMRRALSECLRVLEDDDRSISREIAIGAAKRALGRDEK
jgi:hypothetical protein